MNQEFSVYSRVTIICANRNASNIFHGPELSKFCRRIRRFDDVIIVRKFDECPDFLFWRLDFYFGLTYFCYTVFSCVIEKFIFYVGVAVGFSRWREKPTAKNRLDVIQNPTA